MINLFAYFAQGFRCGHLEAKGNETHSAEAIYDAARTAADVNVEAYAFATHNAWCERYIMGFRWRATDNFQTVPPYIRDAEIPQ